MSQVLRQKGRLQRSAKQMNLILEALPATRSGFPRFTLILEFLDPGISMTTAATAPVSSQSKLTARILPYVLFTFACYLAIGVQLAILPSYVHLNLGFSTVLAGLIISVEYVATVIS